MGAEPVAAKASRKRKGLSASVPSVPAAASVALASSTRPLTVSDAADSNAVACAPVSASTSPVPAVDRPRMVAVGMFCSLANEKESSGTTGGLLKVLTPPIVWSPVTCTKLAALTLAALLAASVELVAALVAESAAAVALLAAAAALLAAAFCEAVALVAASPAVVALLAAAVCEAEALVAALS